MTEHWHELVRGLGSVAVGVGAAGAYMGYTDRRVAVGLVVGGLILAVVGSWPRQ